MRKQNRTSSGRNEMELILCYAAFTARDPTPHAPLPRQSSFICVTGVNGARMNAGCAARCAHAGDETLRQEIVNGRMVWGGEDGQQQDHCIVQQIHGYEVLCSQSTNGRNTSLTTKKKKRSLKQRNFITLQEQQGLFSIIQHSRIYFLTYLQYICKVLLNQIIIHTSL